MLDADRQAHQPVGEAGGVATADPPFPDPSRASGVWLTRDGGATWARINRGPSMTRGNGIAFDPFDPGRLVFGTSGRGFFELRLGESARGGEDSGAKIRDLGLLRR